MDRNQTDRTAVAILAAIAPYASFMTSTAMRAAAESGADEAATWATIDDLEREGVIVSFGDDAWLHMPVLLSQTQTQRESTP